MPRQQGKGRADVQGRPVLYLASAAAAAVAEVFADIEEWSDAMFLAPAFPGARRSLGTYELKARARVADLDDLDTLRRLGLRPTQVVTSDRAVTQAWARKLAAEGTWAGVRWWSSVNADWYIYAVWERNELEVRSVERLALEHPALIEAARVLHRRLPRTTRGRAR